LLTANAIAHAETADTSADQTEISIASHAQPRVSKLKPYSVMELEDAHLKELTIHQRQKTQPQLLVTNQWLSLLQTKDGELSILTRPKRLLLKDSMKSSDSMSTDHSTLSQDFQCKELLSALVQAKSPSRDGERMLLLKHGSSIQYPRQSDLTTGRITPCTSQAMEHKMNSE